MALKKETPLSLLALRLLLTIQLIKEVERLTPSYPSAQPNPSSDPPAAQRLTPNRGGSFAMVAYDLHAARSGGRSSTPILFDLSAALDLDDHPPP